MDTLNGILALTREVEYGCRYLVLKCRQLLGDETLNREFKCENPQNPLVVFLHGMKGTPLIWYDWLDALPEDCDWWIPRLVDGGNRPAEEIVEHLMPRLMELVNPSVGLPRSKVCLVGASNGGRLALYLAKRMMERRAAVPFDELRVVSIAAPHLGTSLLDDQPWIGKMCGLTWPVRQELSHAQYHTHGIQPPPDTPHDSRVRYFFVATPHDWIVQPIASCLLHRTHGCYSVLEGESHHSVVARAKPLVIGFLFDDHDDPVPPITGGATLN